MLARFVQSYPDAARARRVLVVVLREKESAKYDQALEQARELFKRQPGDAAALAELSLTHLAQKQVDVAELLIEEALKAEPHSAVVERAAGLIALEARGRRDRVQPFRQGIRPRSQRHRRRAQHGNSPVAGRRIHRAEKHFRAVLAVQPESTEAKLGLAAALRGQGSRKDPGPYREAESVLKEISRAHRGTGPRHIIWPFYIRSRWTAPMKRRPSFTLSEQCAVGASRPRKGEKMGRRAHHRVDQSERSEVRRVPARSATVAKMTSGR